ncbi:enoyl-CoA hydratase [Aurantimicrobium minutum]|uniref:crotonase/enoyl-CoA hydratase family protein n=1 Tax=Aurantimicrobium minutum TaxID=708131 RepID=UPI002476F604|nr:crotonase/enoyl-CoA hydratase family protein [Aurantimicrobium minutum]MDH6531795.1 enoyl-CoA hydratase [Aurantimicrobium minutum]
MAEPLILFSTTGHIRHLQFNRAEKMNAANRKLLSELSLAYADADADHNIRVVVVSAVGPHFTAGLDLADVLGTASESGLNLTPEAGIDPWGITTPPISKPVVIAVQGTCLTLGVELILASELTVADETTIFGQLEVTRGIMPFGGATTRFAQRVGWAHASRYLLTGETFTAGEALRIGLVNEVVPAGTQVDRAMELAALIAEQAPLAVQATLRNARVARAAAEREALSQLPHELGTLLASEDFRAGVAAFTTRSKPEFTGK